MQPITSPSVPKSEYEVALQSLFGNHGEVLSIFEKVFRDWCFKNPKEANLFFHELSEKGLSIQPKEQFYG